MRVLKWVYGGMAQKNVSEVSSLYSVGVQSAIGADLNLAQYEGRPVLFVNTASQCGFTKQYDDLEALYQRYRNQGMEIVGCPSNDFGKQEPGSDSEIESFCRINFGVTFRLIPKGIVRGGNKQPLFRFLTEQGPADLQGEVWWNFEKFLVDSQGRLVGRWRSYVKPLSGSIQRAIERLL